MNMNFEYVCQNCTRTNEIYVEVDSPSDYYFEDNCNFCRHKLVGLADKVYEEVTDGFIGAAEMLEDR
jgi:hypothetical protein